MARVEDGPDGRYAAFIAGDTERPATGVPLIDTWIARADALRSLRRGRIATANPVPLTSTDLIAAAEEVSRVTRESTVKLLQAAPPDQRPALLALAAVADMQVPDDTCLTAAILELLASSVAWRGLTSGTSADAGEAPAEDAGEPASGTVGRPRGIRRPCEEALAAWRLRDVTGITNQTKIATMLSEQFKRKIGQGQVSRWLKEVEKYLSDGNVLPPLPPPAPRAGAIDPMYIEMGERQDHRTPHQRQRRDDDDEH